MEKNKFFLTTPIYYVNDKPHIGHAYTTILADMLARFHRSIGDEVFFLTGLDEHGQKVQQVAEKRGIPPQQHCDEMAPRFLELWQRLNIQYDDFVRTTQERHKKVVQTCLQQLFEKGEIYTSEYEGWYSVAEERFITETEVKSGQFRDVKTLKEKNYFFKMGKYQQRLIDHIEKNPNFILPETRRNEILGFLKQPLGDLCISRPKARLSWGIELPFDKDYVTYVWFDALVNYISIPGYTTDDAKFNKWWPANLHLIGKDILTTHAVYWSTMLFALGLPLPKTIFAHGWWLIGETKMSKSLGNVVNPLDLIDQYGVDAVRYYLMAEMVLGQDANFTPELFIRRYNNDLANDFGNLLNRMSGLIGKHFEGCVPVMGPSTPAEKEIVEYGKDLAATIKNHIDQLKVQTAVEAIMELVRKVNSYVEKQAPWSEMKKGNKERAGTILYTATEALRIAAVLLQPVMPTKAKEVLEVMDAVGSQPKWGELKSGTQLKTHSALFPRIEVNNV